MIAKFAKHFKENRPPRVCRLRRSSRNIDKEREFAREYSIQEHILYRKEEIFMINQWIETVKTVEDVMKTRCHILTGKIGEELIMPYILTYCEDGDKINCRKIMECLLNKMDERLTSLEYYLNYCIMSDTIDDTMKYKCNILNSIKVLV